MARAFDEGGNLKEKQRLSVEKLSRELTDALTQTEGLIDEKRTACFSS